jgi:hypothetical protein
MFLTICNLQSSYNLNFYTLDLRSNLKLYDIKDYMLEESNLNENYMTFLDVIPLESMSIY